jgi:glycosyltransferase involved in cell wall biosynthesis
MTNPESSTTTDWEYVLIERNLWAGSRGASRALRSLYDALPADRRKLLTVGRPSDLFSLGRRRSPLDKSRVRKKVLIASSMLDVFTILGAKLWRPGTVAVGPIYHLVPWSPNPEPLSLRLPKFLVQRTAAALARLTFDGILTENSHLAEWIREGNPRVHVIRKSPGIPRRWVPGQPPSLDRTTRDIDILFVSAVKESKGVYDALQAWERISQAEPGRRMVVAGYADAGDEAKVRSYIRRRALRNVELRVNVEEKEKYDLLGRSKMTILPAYMEGIPYIFYEAMAYGSIVLTYALPTYVDVRSHIVEVPVENVEALAQRALQVLRDDPSKWQRWIAEGFEFSLQHEFEKVMTEVAEDLRSWIEDPRAQSISVQI